MVGNIWISQSIYAAVELGIPERLAGGPKRADEIARSVEANTGAVGRLMRALASIGVVTQSEDGAFGLSPLGNFLRTDTRDSLTSWVNDRPSRIA